MADCSDESINDDLYKIRGQECFLPEPNESTKSFEIFIADEVVTLLNLVQDADVDMSGVSATRSKIQKPPTFDAASEKGRRNIEIFVKKGIKKLQEQIRLLLSKVCYLQQKKRPQT